MNMETPLSELSAALPKTKVASKNNSLGASPSGTIQKDSMKDAGWVRGGTCGRFLLSDIGSSLSTNQVLSECSEIPREENDGKIQQVML